MSVCVGVCVRFSHFSSGFHFSKHIKTKTQSLLVTKETAGLLVTIRNENKSYIIVRYVGERMDDDVVC